MREKLNEPEKDPTAGVIYRFIIRPILRPVAHDGTKFIVRLRPTFNLVCVVMLVMLDIGFATDSIPAILGISTNRFVVFSVNAMALLGLKPMYYVLAVLKSRFVLLGKGLGFVLSYIGVKLVIEADDWLVVDNPLNVHIPITVSLIITVTFITCSIIASLIYTRGSKNSNYNEYRDRITVGV